MKMLDFYIWGAVTTGLALVVVILLRLYAMGG